MDEPRKLPPMKKRRKRSSRDGNIKLSDRQQLNHIPPMNLKEPAYGRLLQHHAVLDAGHQIPRPTWPHSQLGPVFEMKRIDYVLVYRKETAAVDSDDEDKREKCKAADMLRTSFEQCLAEEGLVTETEATEEYMFVKVHCPFVRLVHQAERMRLEMPLKEVSSSLSQASNWCTKMLDRAFKTDSEETYVCVPLEQSKLKKFQNCESPNTFFRPALRSLMVYNILTELDMSKHVSTHKMHLKSDAANTSAITSKLGLPYLLLKDVYSDAYSLHDESEKETKKLLRCANSSAKTSSLGAQTAHFRRPLDIVAGTGSNEASTWTHKAELNNLDERKDLDKSWPRLFVYQPLHKIKNYFGEEIALYFAWSGILMLSIIVPATFGLAIFLYGLWLSIDSNGKASILQSLATTANVTVLSTQSMLTTSMNDGKNSSTGASATTPSAESSFMQGLQDYGEDVLKVIQLALDNQITPWYSVVICLWGTLFLEVWKRRGTVLAYEWRVQQFEANELLRPQFGGQAKPDPVTGMMTAHYPAHKHAFKYLLTFSIFLLMICVVLIVSTSFIVYRIVLGVDYCSTGRWSGLTCTVVTSLCGTVANACSIMALGKLYTMLAYKLTDWENHKTESAYKDALIIKLFAFLFANAYTSLYYIAFFRGNDATFGDTGILGLGSSYRDSCGTDGNCMSMLSLQVLVLITLKPLPKICADVVLPWFRNKLGRRQNTTVGAVLSTTSLDAWAAYLEKERQKPLLENFTLNEYTEKVLQYGYLMLFAVSMPLAPLIILLTHLLDRFVDSKRLLWWYRRPIAFIAQDIGVWHNILGLLNVCGVITNALLIAYTSSWGQEHLTTPYSQLLFILVFEHGVFALMYLIAKMIPDVPGSVKTAMRREKYLAARTMESGRFLRRSTKMLGMADEEDVAAPAVPHQDPSGGVQRRGQPEGCDGTAEMAAGNLAGIPHDSACTNPESAGLTGLSHIYDSPSRISMGQ